MLLINVQRKAQHALRSVWACTHTDLASKTKPKEEILHIILFKEYQLRY